MAVDAVGWDNQLIDGRSYEYVLYQGSSGSEEIVDRVTLTAKVPDRENFTIALNEADIQVKPYKSVAATEADMLLSASPISPT